MPVVNYGSRTASTCLDDAVDGSVGGLDATANKQNVESRAFAAPSSDNPVPTKDLRQLLSLVSLPKWLLLMVSMARTPHSFGAVVRLRTLSHQERLRAEEGFKAWCSFQSDATVDV